MSTMTSEPIQVLLVEDNPVDCRLIRGLLAEPAGPPFSVSCAAGLREAREQLQSAGADVVLLDLTLPDSAGLQSFEQLHRHFAHLPIVILTGLEDESLAAKAIEQGAQDYLIKGQVERAGLTRALRYAIERKRAAEAIHRLNEELEQRVLERTRDLTVSNRELEAFCRSVAHDLRTPLRAIDGFSRALERQADQLDHQGRAYLRRVREAAQRMAQMIDAMLDMSRVARCAMRRQRLDLSAMAREIISQLQAAGQGEGVEFVVADGLEAWGDPQLVWMVLENLLDNACKFSRAQANPRVELRSDAPGSFLVRDNGIGFDMAYADKLYDPFERLHGGFEGIGIGLATAHRIIQRHGGRIWAESAPGAGAVFHFTLPDLAVNTAATRLLR